MKQVVIDGTTYDFELERCNIVFDEEGGALWTAAWRVKLDGVTKWIHEITRTDVVTSIADIEEFI